MKAQERKALEGALRRLGVPEEEIASNPTKAGIRFLFSDLSPATPDPPPTPSKDENAA
jgi:hypothetical protein